MRRKWEDLTPEEQAVYDWVDLEPGETMHDWYDAYEEANEEVSRHQAMAERALEERRAVMEWLEYMTTDADGLYRNIVAEGRKLLRPEPEPGRKVCPRCGTEVFDDMAVCYGCLYQFRK